jgi:hypothetical protein
MERKDWNYKTYLGDCIDGMRLLPAGSVDFLFTDLPYMGEQTASGTHRLILRRSGAKLTA